MEKKTLHKKVPLWRKTVEILGTALICGLIAFLICHFMVTPQYQATASMEVSFAHLPGAFYTSFETGVEVDLAKEYAGLFRLDSTRYNAAGAAGIDVAEIDKNVSVSATPGTQTMYFKASFPTPEQAQAAANAYMKAFDETLKDNTGYDDENLLLEAQLPSAPSSPKTGIVTIVTMLIAAMIGEEVLLLVFHLLGVVQSLVHVSVAVSVRDPLHGLGRRFTQRDCRADSLNEQELLLLAQSLAFFFFLPAGFFLLVLLDLLLGDPALQEPEAEAGDG